MESPPLISIIIPAYNASKTIRGCINSLLSQEYPNTEIIVIDDGSTDNTDLILKEFNNIRILKTLGIGPSAARNYALNNARGELVAFTDADCITDPRWLNELYQDLVRHDVVGVGGPQFCPSDETRFGKEVHQLFSEIGFVTDYSRNKGTSSPTKHNPSCNVLYKKDILNRMDGFKQNLWPGEDTDLDRRITKAGYKLRHSPNAIVYHYRPESVSKLLKMMMSYGSAQAFLVKNHGFFRKIHFLPVLIPPLVIGELVLLRINVDMFLVINISLLVGIYLYFLVRTRRIGKAFLHLGLFFLVNLGWLLGFFKNLVGISLDSHLRRDNIEK